MTRRQRSFVTISVATGVLFLCWYLPVSPVWLSLQLKRADRVIVSDRIGLRRILTDEQVPTLVTALSSAERDRNTYAATFSSKMEFYRGTNCLGAYHFQGRLFWANNWQFSEGTGLLARLYNQLYSDERARLSWAEGLVQDVTTKPELRNLQSWSVDTLRRYASGQLQTRNNTSRDRIELEERDIPVWLRTAWQHAPAVYLRPGPSGGAECLMLDWHYAYGLLVGPTNYTTTFAAWFVTNAAPGIYVYHQ